MSADSASTTVPIGTSPPTAPVAAAVLSLADFDILRPIGKGDTDNVFLVRHKETQALYALKIAPKTGKAAADLPLEQEILLSAAQDSSPFVLRLVGSWHDSANYYLLSISHFRRPSLFRLIIESRFSRERAKLYVAQLLSTFAHTSIRISPVCIVDPSIFDGNGNVILCDLGLGKYFPLSTDPREPDFVNFEVDPNATSGSFRWEEAPVTSERCGTPGFASRQPSDARPIQQGVSGRAGTLRGGGLS
ncbi:kinase-like domain-containing protein [Mycena rosella]|uniref:non-specific serine/threonine protein kinase n=1 Tax=Mycena rosella TaxID=1033263 RepID=A0AAD7CPN1_MYCRO|nr:kinase-like domain-containing protein [Mycena rosella]